MLEFRFTLSCVKVQREQTEVVITWFLQTFNVKYRNILVYMVSCICNEMSQTKCTENTCTQPTEMLFFSKDGKHFFFNMNDHNCPILWRLWGCHLTEILTCVGTAVQCFKNSSSLYYVMDECHGRYFVSNSMLRILNTSLSFCCKSKVIYVDIYSVGLMC